MAFTFKKRSNLPGFGLALGYTVLYLSLIVLIPLAATFLKASSLSWEQFWHIVASPRAVASYRLTFGASLIGAVVNLVFGILVAWVLVRYSFPGKRIFDSLVDLPFALPTAVAGIALTTIYAPNGWLGRPLAAVGIKSAYTPLGVCIALTFIGLPFVVRSVQPVLEDMDKELEEAAASLGANRWQTFSRVVLPTIFPAALAGFAMAFARAHRGIRLGRIHRRQHADENRDYAAADHHQARPVRLRRRHRDRRGHAGVLVDPVAAD